MRQRRWLELIKDYDLQIMYHPGKANTVADALSRKFMGNLACLLTGQKTVLHELAIVEEIKKKQLQDEFLKKIVDEREFKPRPGFNFESATLKFQGRLCVPNNSDLKKGILQKAHSSNFSIHSGNTKMYQDLKKNFWWPGMKKEIAEFVSKCLQCQQVKAEHQRPVRLFQLLPIPEWNGNISQWILWLACLALIKVWILFV